MMMKWMHRIIFPKCEDLLLEVKKVRLVVSFFLIVFLPVTFCKPVGCLVCLSVRVD